MTPAVTATTTVDPTVTATPTVIVTPTATGTAPTSPPLTRPTTPPSRGDVYTTPGYHDVNGRRWFTTCEPYSQAWRCGTDIWATQVTVQGGKFVKKTGWFFNNLTYLPSPRAQLVQQPAGLHGCVDELGGSQVDDQMRHSGNKKATTP